MARPCQANTMELSSHRQAAFLSLYLCLHLNNIYTKTTETNLPGNLHGLS